METSKEVNLTIPFRFREINLIGNTRFFAVIIKAPKSQIVVKIPFKVLYVIQAAKQFLLIISLGLS